MSSKAKLFVILMIVLAAAASAVPAGQTAAPSGGRGPAGPQKEVSVILKLVQVFVADRYGRPIPDLGLSDFELLDNGLPQTITAFEAHTVALPGRPGDPAAGAAAAAMPAAVQGRKFYFVFDYFMNDPGGIRRAKEAALHFVDNRLAEPDLAGVVSLSADRGVRVLRELTKDRGAVREAIRKMAGVPRLRDVDATYDLDPGSAEDDEYNGKKGENEFKLEECFRYTSEMDALAAALAKVEGVKNIIFFSRGLALGDLLEAGRDLLDSGTGTFIMDSYNAMLEKISRAGSPVYAVNTEGTRRLPAPGSNPRDNAQKGGAGALVGLADASGGSYFPTAARVTELTRKINETTAHYYVLGYSIGVAWDGRYHKLEVRVKKPGCEVRAQAGYYDPKSFADLTPLEKDIQLMDAVLGKASPFVTASAIPLLALLFSGEGPPARANCFLLAELTRAGLEAVGGSKPELAFFVFDEKGVTVLSSKSDADLSGLKEPSAFVYSPLALTPGAYEARFALRDPGSGRTAVGAAGFVVPSPAGEGRGLTLETPLLLRPGRGAAYLKAAAKEDRGALPSLDAFCPFISVKSAPLVGPLEVGRAPLAAAVRARSTDGSPIPDLEWTARFVRLDTGREDPAEAIEVASEEAGGAHVFLLEIERPDLEPGEYTLVIRAGDADSGRRAEAEARVRVK